MGARLARKAPSLPGYVDVIEAAYDVEARPDAWLVRLAELTCKLVPDGRIGIAYAFDYREPEAPVFSDIAVANAPAGFARQLKTVLGSLRSAEALTVEAIHVGPRVGPAATLSEHLGVEGMKASATGRFLVECDARDSFGCVAADPEGRGVVLSTDLPSVTRLGAATRRRWTQVAAHVAAAYRLRRRLRERASTEAAILHPSGRLADAGSEAAMPMARQRLRDAVRAIDAARTRAGRAAVDESLALWKGLVAGRWSLVERFESDGRRYFVARRNDPDVPAPLALTRRERQIVGYAALGHPLKLIAYELGLSVSTVAGHRASAMSKLGVRSLADLASLRGAP